MPSPKRSWVWNPAIMEELFVGENVVVRCKLCPRKYTKASTSNIAKHL
jgi:hypothetical protein